jgi:triacylglycerol lipase
MTSMLPVVLHHGLFGSGDVRVGPVTLRYFRGIDRAIAARGHPVIVPWVHPSSSVAHRAAQLADHVRRDLAAMGRLGQKVILIGHSMGGLDARYAVAKLGLDEHVAAVVTITAPHRGSPYASWIARNVVGRLGVGRLAGWLRMDIRAVADLTTEGCAAFNDAVPDVPGLPYFSVSAARPWSKMPPFALHSHAIVNGAEGENDGLVSVRSSTWGTHLGTWAADHWHTINRRYRPELNHPTGSILPYWLRLLDQVTVGLSGVAPHEPCSTSRSSAAA